jgi:hypothetical protein
VFKKYRTIEEDTDKNKTFFCTELVASAYKYLGLFDKNIASS